MPAIEISLAGTRLTLNGKIETALAVEKRGDALKPNMNMKIRKNCNFNLAGVQEVGGRSVEGWRRCRRQGVDGQGWRAAVEEERASPSEFVCFYLFLSSSQDLI